jgi:hypothetical protein
VDPLLSPSDWLSKVSFASWKDCSKASLIPSSGTLSTSVPTERLSNQSKFFFSLFISLTYEFIECLFYKFMQMITQETWTSIATVSMNERSFQKEHDDGFDCLPIKNCHI